jgi:hypothetical protein
MRGNRMSQATFAERFFGRSADDPVAQALRSAADRANAATTPADMAQAAAKLAEAMKKVGLDRWPRFLADARARSRDPETEAAIKESLKPIDPQRDAIRPVYPLEALAGGAGARGVAALARAAGRAALRQFMPESRPPSGEAATQSAEPPRTATASDTTAPGSARTAPISRQRQDGHISGTPQNQNRLRQGKPTSTFQGDATSADALTREAWARGKPVPGRTGVREYEFGRRIGSGPRGGGQSAVRVHQDAEGRIHGHPSGPESP